MQHTATARSGWRAATGNSSLPVQILTLIHIMCVFFKLITAFSGLMLSVCPKVHVPC